MGVDKKFLETLYPTHKGMANSVLEGSDFRVLEDFIFSFFPALMTVMFKSFDGEGNEGTLLWCHVSCLRPPH